MLILSWIWNSYPSRLCLEGVPNLAIRPAPTLRLPFTTTVNPDAINVFDLILI
jgi:hypothetical protein